MLSVHFVTVQTAYSESFQGSSTDLFTQFCSRSGHYLLALWLLSIAESPEIGKQQ